MIKDQTFIILAHRTQKHICSFWQECMLFIFPYLTGFKQQQTWWWHRLIFVNKPKFCTVLTCIFTMSQCSQHWPCHDAAKKTHTTVLSKSHSHDRATLWHYRTARSPAYCCTGFEIYKVLAWRYLRQPCHLHRHGVEYANKSKFRSLLYAPDPTDHKCIYCLPVATLGLLFLPKGIWNGTVLF